MLEPPYSMTHEVSTYRISIKDIGGNHFGENTLSPDVPHLQGDIDIPWQFYPLDEEIQPQSLLISLSKVFIDEAIDHGCLANGSIT